MNSRQRDACDLVPGLAPIADRLIVYEQILLRWQRKINLVGRSTLEDVWRRHFADSARLAQLAPLDVRWADLGSGAGFPGMVIALMQVECHAGEMHLIESDTRKAAFLREVSRETGAGAHIHNARCEDVLPDLQLDVVCSRAMTDMKGLLGYVKPFVEKGAIGLFMKGRDVAAELTQASIPSNFLISFAPSKIDADSTIVQVRTA